MSLLKRSVAEFIGTFWLVFGGCGSAVLASKFIAEEGSTPINLGIAFVGVALAFGLTVLTMAYAIGHISGCHLNPAVSIGLCTAGRVPARELPHYIIAQVLAGLVAAATLAFVANGAPDFKLAGGLASNGFTDPNMGGDHSPGHYNLMSCVVVEVLMTFFFLMIILNATDKKAPAGFAPLAIGLGLTLIHLISIPVTNTSVNPARSTGPAVIIALAGETWALMQLWLFWVAPIAGAVLAGVVYKWFSAEEPSNAKKVK